MNANVSFYMQGSLEERLPQLVAEDSPLILSDHSDDIFLKSRDRRVRPFHYVPCSIRLMQTPMHADVQKALSIEPNTCMYNEQGSIDGKVSAALVNIMEHLAIVGIPFYMTLGEQFVRGYNPHNKIEAVNQIFMKLMPDLFIESAERNLSDAKNS